jgi:hypothetical protein
MGYIGQRSRGLAVRRLEELLDDKDREDLKRIAERLRQLSEVFKPEEHLVQTSFNNARRLISVAVDGGDNLIEPEAREIATGFIRVSAFSPDFKELPQPLEFAVKGFRLFAEDDNELSRRISQYIEQLFDHEIFKVFSKETGITTSDLGTYYRKGVPALVSILRDVDELMDYVYTTSRQWDPNREKSLVFGRRHLLRFRKKEFEPLESAIAFDVPEYLAQNKEALSQVVATLWAHRSALYGGSLGPLVEAHERASVGDPVIRRLEQELWNLVEREVFRNG